jgi:beta-glucosidase
VQAAQPAVSRLGLPSYSFARECERGDTSGRTGTAFPSGLALGSTFDPLLINEVAFATAIEVRANVNVDVAAGGPFGSSCFGPVSNLVKDSRWYVSSEARVRILLRTVHTHAAM